MTQNDIADRLDALEAQLDDQQKTIDRQQERIEAQEAIINAQQKRLDADGGDADDSEEIDANGSDADGDDSERAVLNRRTALQAGGVLGLLGLGAGTASADASGQIGTSSDPLQQLYTEELNGGVTGDAQLTNIAGSNLSIDSSGNLNASGGGSGAWVEGDNTSLLEPVSKDGIEVDTIADNGSNSLTVNTGGDRVLDLSTVTQTTIDGTDVDGCGNVVAGHPLNSTSAVGAVISGGGMETTSGTDFPNTVSGDFGTISGGINNEASKLASTVGGGGQNTAKGGSYATVGGGYRNTASGESTTVGGGQRNDALAGSATVSGGYGNEAIDSETTVSGGTSNTAGSSTDSASFATVGGGRGNTASASYATVPGGRLNTADGDYSFAAGHEANANSKSGAFVWGDSSSTTVTAGAADEVRFQATGGFVIAPESDSTTMLDVQDQGGNSLLAADTTNHKVQVFDGDATDSVDVSHDGTDGVVSTTTGDLKLDPAGSAKITSAPSESGDIISWNEGVESGTEVIGGLSGGGGDDTWGSSNKKTTSVTFDNSFDQTPIVSVSIDESTTVPADEFKVSVQGRSTDGFELVVYQMADNDNGGKKYAVNYIATTGRPSPDA